MQQGFSATIMSLDFILSINKSLKCSYIYKMVTLVLRSKSGSGKIRVLLLSVVHRPAASD